MVQEYVLARQGCENIAAVHQFIRNARCKGRVEQFRSIVEIAHGYQPIKVDGPVYKVHIALVEAEVLQ